MREAAPTPAPPAEPAAPATVAMGAEPAAPPAATFPAPSAAAPTTPAFATLTTCATAEWPLSSASTRSASDSSVKSESGRHMRVSAISKVRRAFVDVLRSAATSPKTHSMRASLSGPNSGSSSASSRRTDSLTSRATSSPANASTYMLRMCSAKSRTNCARSAPVSTYSAVQRKHAATSRLPTACTMAANSLESSDPNMRSATSIVTLPSPNAIICSNDVSAFRKPPSARCAIRSSASPSNSTPSATHTAPKRATMASGEMRRKSKRWQRE